jgi:hypothetical protein
MKNVLSKRKRLLTLIMLCGMMHGYAQNTPPHAASTRTWTFGTQTWSDAIRIPACNKKSLLESATNPQCCSYTEQGNTFYYYNWAYVDANEDKLCRSPWRVPSKEDFDILESNTNHATLIDAWGYGGRAYGSSMDGVRAYAHYWSSTAYNDYAYYLGYYNGMLAVSYSNKRYWFQVRCVR